MSILLINPFPSKKAAFPGRLSLSLLFLATFLKTHNIHSKIYIDNEDFNVKTSKDFEFVGFTGMTYQINRALEIAKTIKKNYPQKKIVFGGVFASLNCNTLKNFDFIDHIIIGEGEIVLKKLLENKIKDRIIKGISLPPDKIPIIDRRICKDNGIFYDHAFKAKSAILMFSRGCNGHCTFCATPYLFGKPEFIKPERAIDEIKYIIEEFDITNFAIEDDNFMFNKEFIIKFYELIKKNNIKISFRINSRLDDIDYEKLKYLKEIGLKKISIGIEHIDKKILKILNKDLNLEKLYSVKKWCETLGVELALLAIVGSPYETIDTLKKLKDFIVDFSPSGGYDFQVLQPHPGLPIRKICEKYGKILTHDLDDYFSDNITYIPPFFKDEKEYKTLLRKITNKKINLSNEKEPLLSEILINQGKTIIIIPPDKFKDAKFNLEVSHWTGSEKCKEGLSIIKCKDFGKISYEFYIKKLYNIDTKAFLYSRLASHPINWPQELEYHSNLIIRINNIKIAEILVKPIHTIGELKKIPFSKNILKVGKNLLEFEIPENAKYKSGFSIFYKPLNCFYSSYETPIIIEI